MLWIRHQDPFSNLQQQLPALQSRQLDRIIHHIKKLIVAELSRTHVDRHIELSSGDFLEASDLHARGLQCPCTKQIDEAIAFRHRNELHRRHCPQLGPHPAHQCFETHYLAGPGIDDRLIMQQEFAVPDGLEHRRFHRNIMFRQGELLRAVDNTSGLAGFLRAVHGGIGMRQ